MTTETQFLAPGDMVEDAQATAEAAALLVGPAALIGTWNCCDAATRGLVRVVIAGSGPAITVHVFGACSPTPCDWSVVPGLAYAESVSSSTSVAFTARYEFSFKETIVTGVLDSGSLRVETFDHFTDGSGRSDHYSRGYFCKQRRR
jgi:hypothetical protein